MFRIFRKKNKTPGDFFFIVQAGFAKVHTDPDGPWRGEVVELGPVNATIHSVDECTAIADLGKLSNMYRGILDRLLVTPR